MEGALQRRSARRVGRTGGAGTLWGRYERWWMDRLGRERCGWVGGEGGQGDGWMRLDALGLGLGHGGPSVWASFVCAVYAAFCTEGPFSMFFRKSSCKFWPPFLDPDSPATRCQPTSKLLSFSIQNLSRNAYNCISHEIASRLPLLLERPFRH